MISNYVQKLWSNFSSNTPYLDTCPYGLSFSSTASIVTMLFISALILAWVIILSSTTAFLAVSWVINSEKGIKIFIAWVVGLAIIWILLSVFIFIVFADLSAVLLLEPLSILPRRLSVEGFSAEQVINFGQCYKNALLVCFQQDVFKTSWTVVDPMFRFECFDLGHWDVMDALLKERAAGSDYSSHIMTRSDLSTSGNSEPNLHLNRSLITRLLENRIGEPFVTV